MDNPLVGIVIPAYNCERFIDLTLNSIQNQSYQNWHCVIVDDGSCDATPQMLDIYCRKDARFSVLHQKNSGVSGARNAGFSRLPPTCAYVTFMDNDDVWLSNALEKLVIAAMSHQETIGAHGLAEMIDEHGQVLQEGGFSGFGSKRVGLNCGRVAPWHVGLPTAFETLIFLNTVYPPGLLLLKKELYDIVGPWDESFAAVQDWDMLVRVSRHGSIHFVPDVIIHYRRHGINGSNNHRRNLLETRRLYHKIFFSPENSSEHRKIVREGWRAWQQKRISEKSSDALVALKRRDLKAAALSYCHILAHFIRLVRGYPRATGI